MRLRMRMPGCGTAFGGEAAGHQQLLAYPLRRKGRVGSLRLAGLHQRRLLQWHCWWRLHEGWEPKLQSASAFVKLEIGRIEDTTKKLPQLAVVHAVAPFGLAGNPPRHLVAAPPDEVVEHSLNVGIPQIGVHAAKAVYIHGVDAHAAALRAVLHPEPKDPVTEPPPPLHEDV